MHLLAKLFAATVGCLAATTLAQAQSTAEARIANLTVELHDLNLADGVAPSMTIYQLNFGPVAGWEIFDEHAGSLRRDSNTTSAPLTPVSIAHSVTDLPHTRSALSAGVSGATLADLALVATASMVDTVGLNASSAYAHTQNVWFLLSPHTRVTFSADLSVRSNAGAVAGPGLHAIANASAVMGLFAPRENMSQSAPLYHNAVFGEDRGPGWDATYSVSLSNTRDSSNDYALGLNAGAMAYTSAVIPAPVPEPATGLMLLAGLGVLVRTRSKRARSVATPQVTTVPAAF